MNLFSDTFTGSVNHQSNLNIFAELMGAISTIRFASVIDRFVNELRSAATTIGETRGDLIIKSMRYFRLKLYPMDSLDETVDFLQTLADLYNNAHSASLKHSYTQLFYDLLTPIGAVRLIKDFYLSQVTINIKRWPWRK